ncbi:Lysine-specific demethylase 7A [Podila minutissima]|uniref:JmjC domain-containing histone demethylation protein 1 n=1 Tax=Podila minutissima TaxID=64525 RepID=A0A9P5STU0_9FUNG|nr:Lysine-specific demethylase 7A [Podila minutissima]
MRECPLCTKEVPTSIMIGCEHCNIYYHIVCIPMTIEQSEEVDKYHCRNCEPIAGPSVHQPSKSGRQNANTSALQSKWKDTLESRTFLPSDTVVQRITGHELTLEYLRTTGFALPIIVGEGPRTTRSSKSDSHAALGMQMPERGLTVGAVRDAVGGELLVPVIDVASQSEMDEWTMDRWAAYFRKKNKARILNVISLQITGTRLAEQIVVPRIVRELDWGSFTNFHVDFGGSSVFYHILSGSKIFYVVEPTATNLKKYTEWSMNQEANFFSDLVDGQCYKMELKEGDTLFVPSGWIHAVFTPTNSIVFGGNFLHSLHIPMQNRIVDIEIETDTPSKFRFPQFDKLNWYAALGCAQRGSAYLAGLSDIELNGLQELISRLADQQKQLKAKGVKLSKDEKRAIKVTVPDEAAAWMSVINGKLEHGGLSLLMELDQTVRQVLAAKQSGVDDEKKKGRVEGSALDGSDEIARPESSDQRDSKESSTWHTLEQNVHCTTKAEVLVKEESAEKRPRPSSYGDTMPTAEKAVVFEDDTGRVRSRRVNRVLSCPND